MKGRVVTDMGQINVDLDVIAKYAGPGGPLSALASWGWRWSV